MKSAATLSLLLFLALGAMQSGRAVGDAYFDRYDLAPREDRLDLGVQPLGYPTGVVGALLRRDRILRDELRRLGLALNVHAFRRGPDMLPFLGGGRLEAALLGDMPTLAAALREPVWVAGLVKRSFTSVVSREEGWLGALKGKPVAYVEGSSAHYTLLQALESVGLGETDVRLLPLGVDEMPVALEEKRISAFSAWEPAASIALARSVSHRVVFRSPSADYLVVARSFEARHPEAVRHLTAALVRGVAWLRQSREHVESAVRWTQADAQGLVGGAPQPDVGQAVAIVRSELLDVPSAPKLPTGGAAIAPLAGEFKFLQRLGKIGAQARWEDVASAFVYRGIEEVIAAPERFRPYAFDYDP